MTDALPAGMRIETYDPTDRQRAAHLAEADDVLMGGAKGGGKSVWLCNQALKMCKLYKRLNASTAEWPVRFWMGRKRSVHFKHTTLRTWQEQVPQVLYHYNKSDGELHLPALHAIIDTGGLDDELTIKKFNSAAYAGIFGDQTEEWTRDDLAMLQGTLRFKFADGSFPRYRTFLTANPPCRWLKEDFVLAPSGQRAFVPSLPKDNPHLPPGYVDRLRQAFHHRPELVRAYVEGAWDDLEDFDTVIQHSWVLGIVERPLFASLIRRRLVVCDPARFGDDETAIYGLENGRILEQKIYGQQDLMHTAGECVIMQNRLGASHIVIETDGLGAGVEDRLREMGRKVIGVQMGAKALDPVRFKDRRSEVWWTAGEMIQAGTDCSIPNDPKLIGQLCTPKYEIVSKGVIKVERKEDIKERLIAQGGMGAGSPDRATAYVIGLAHLALCEPIDAEKPFRPALSVSQRYKPQAAQLAGTAMAA